MELSHKNIILKKTHGISDQILYEILFVENNNYKNGHSFSNWKSAIYECKFYNIERLVNTLHISFVVSFIKFLYSINENVLSSFSNDKELKIKKLILNKFGYLNYTNNVMTKDYLIAFILLRAIKVIFLFFIAFLVLSFIKAINIVFNYVF